jgi:hypothetical protein
MTNNPILPALILLLLAWAAIVTTAAAALATAKLIAALWKRLNWPSNRPVVDAHTLAPIFDLAALELV